MSEALVEKIIKELEVEFPSLSSLKKCSVTGSKFKESFVLDSPGSHYNFAQVQFNSIMEDFLWENNIGEITSQNLNYRGPFENFNFVLLKTFSPDEVEIEIMISTNFQDIYLYGNKNYLVKTVKTYEDHFVEFSSLEDLRYFFINEDKNLDLLQPQGYNYVRG